MGVGAGAELSCELVAWVGRLLGVRVGVAVGVGVGVGVRVEVRAGVRGGGRVGRRVWGQGLGLGRTVSLVVSERIGLGGRRPAQKVSSSSRPRCPMMPARLMSMGDDPISGAARSRLISSMMPDTPLRCIPPPSPCSLAPAKPLP